MIANIEAVWPGRGGRVTIIVADHADGRIKHCHVWATTTKGQLIATLCTQVARKGEIGSARSAHAGAKVVLTVKPKDPYYGFCIEEAELMPETPQEVRA